MRIQIFDIEKCFRQWIKLLTDKYIFTDFAGSRRMNNPDVSNVDTFIDDSEQIKKKIEAFLNSFEDSDSIYCHGLLNKMNERVENWTDKAIEVY